MSAQPRKRYCCDEDLAAIGYDGVNADADLERWRTGRLYPATQELIDVIRAEGVEGATLLDIGGGVGAVHVSLLESGAATAVDVDASRNYLAVARLEAERLTYDVWGPIWQNLTFLTVVLGLTCVYIARKDF